MRDESGSRSADSFASTRAVEPQRNPRLKPRVRVLLFDHVATLSGGEIALLHLVTHLDLNRVEPIVVLGEAGPLAEALKDWVEVHIIPITAAVRHARKDNLGASAYAPSALLATVRYVFTLSRFMRQRRIDLVHTNSLKADLLGGVAARLARRPCLWHIRDRISPDYLPARVVKMFRFAARWLPDAIIANSHATAETLGAAVSGKVRVVHDGTVLDAFSPEPPQHAGANDEPAHIGIVGRISPWKGQDVFLNAASIVLRSFPSAHFQIIGAALFDEAAFEEHLHQLVTQLGLEAKITFTGFLRDVSGAIGKLAILVHASTKPEPFGQVIIEGMAAAKPIIAINAGGVPEIVTHGRTGLLVPMNDPERMAEAICFLLADPARAAEMGRRAHAHVSEHFTIQKTAAGVMGVYTQLLRA